MTRPEQTPDKGEKRQRETGVSKPEHARSGNDFGQEGTNKTIPVPKSDGAPSEELGNTPHIEKTPYTRG